jgi:diadenosine tetraphosphate (Ap4A) HIT family hydrolase
LQLFENEHFIIEPCEDCPLPGYLIVRPSKAVAGLSALDSEAAAQLGPTLRLAVRAVEAVVNPIKVYAAQFGEAGGALHFHVFPRTEKLTRGFLHEFPEQEALLHGPVLLDWARDKFGKDMDQDETSRVTQEIKTFLQSGS